MDLAPSYSALADFGHALLNRTTLQEGLPMISEYAKQTTGAERCSIFIYNPNIQMLWTTLADGLEKIMVHKEDGIVGHTVNVAARIVDLAGPGELVVSDSVLAGLDPKTATFEPVGPARVKGVETPV